VRRRSDNPPQNLLRNGMDKHDRAAALTAFEAAYWVNVKDPNASILRVPPANYAAFSKSMTSVT
jgi:hypothetical protein